MDKVSDVDPEWQLKTIGRGSFATASVLTGRPVAFKQVIVRARTPELKQEFEMFLVLYDLCSTDSHVAVPRPLAYYNPAAVEFISPSNDAPESTGRRPHVAKPDFQALGLENAAYAMDHVLPLPLAVARAVRDLFYPPLSVPAPSPSLCRLYFGKVIEKVGSAGRPIRFFNSSNFPLDCTRYKLLTETAKHCEFPSMELIAFGMGEMVGRLHWFAGYDARDIEFVLGGQSFSGVLTHVIDFNQMRSWSREKDQIHLLVESFFQNDPYYPRPRASEPLWEDFRRGYVSAYSAHAQKLASIVLQAFEQEQANRDSRHD
ncbi:hypothetical protein BOTBODRAFT_59671 [Botryobasidium botryosum FD-172 SS1]|uniref:DUF3669 domain-containing protein n=1 Tax=Botryobasidium botryosum (strain FD-172 SS1) TaxID=930990 RepID=A0A067LZW5_BOTB1|nr:hypothetical protein BOTBODRAFT_59671 [Botryobasidium botryosum FD-172 SS1]